jgi:putative endonuclease
VTKGEKKVENPGGRVEKSGVYVYIVECADGTLYTGWTNDMERRIDEHNNGKTGARYTRSRRPVRLVHVETWSTVSEALKREALIKRLSRGQKVLLIGSMQSAAS